MWTFAEYDFQVERFHACHLCYEGSGGERTAECLDVAPTAPTASEGRHD